LTFKHAYASFGNASLSGSLGRIPPAGGGYSPQGGTMRTYEVVVIFRHEQDHYTKGLEFVRNELKTQGGNLLKEEDMGERTLAYPIKKQDRGHYVLFNVELPAPKVIEIDKILKLQNEILKFLFIVQED
jgi:small subunit ribosomal protein S6